MTARAENFGREAAPMTMVGLQAAFKAIQALSGRPFWAAAALSAALLGPPEVADAAGASLVSAGPAAVQDVPKGSITLTKDKPFKAVSAGPESVSAGGKVVLRFTVYLLDDHHYLYKEMMKVEAKPVDGVTFAATRFVQAPELKFDSFEERNREVYKHPVTMVLEGTVDGNAKPGPRTVEATVRYQGCNPTTCFMPAKEAHSLTFTVGSLQGSSGQDASTEGGSAAQAAAGGEGGAGGGAAGGSGGGASAGGTAGGTASAGGLAVPASHEGGEAADPVEAGEGAAAAGSAGGVVAGGLAGEGAAGVGAAGEGAAGGAAGGASLSAALDASQAQKSTASGATVAAAATTEVVPQQGLITIDPSKGIFRLLLLFFGSGFIASLTPCVYPIIPITVSVLGARQASSRLQGFSKALVYVLGLATTYTVLGVVAASTGALFGSIMQNAWVLGGISVLFILMGFGMMGAFEVAMPSGFTTRLATVRGRGYPGAYLMGAIAGLVASPCVGPIVVSGMTYIAQTGDIKLGAALMFAFALGMGQLFLALGTFAIAMPRSGAWMDTVKGVMSLMMFGVGLYYLQFVIPTGYYELLLGASAVVAGTMVGAFQSLNDESGMGQKLSKAGGILLLVVGLYAFVGGLLGTRLVAPQVAAALTAPAGSSSVALAQIRWSEDYDSAMSRARSEQRPVVIDFSAAWCGACKELEHYTFTDARVIEAASEFVTIRVDGTDETPLFERLKKEYGIPGLPFVLFLDGEGKVQNQLTVTGFVQADEFLKRMCQVNGPQVARLQSVCRSS